MSTEKNPFSKNIPLLSVLMLGTFLSVLNQTLLNVAIPPLINEFNISPSTGEWLMTGYMLVNGILIPLSPFLIERFGTRKLFIGAMLLFTGGSLICGLSPTFSVLLTGRLIQATAAGVMMPLVMTIILTIFPPEVRGKGMGIFGLGITFAPAIGPTLSGWLLEHYNWRVLFNGMVPLAAIITLLAFLLLKDIQKEQQNKLDIWGAVISTIGFGSLLYGLNEAGREGWSSPLVLSFLTVGCIFIGIFIYQQIHAKKPLLDFRVFKYDVFLLSTIINMIITIAMFSGMFLLPIYLQNLRGFSPFEAGLLMLPGAIIMGIMSPISGYLFDKIGPRWLAAIGMLITTITTWGFTRLSLDTSYSYILLLYMVRSFGMSLLMMPIMTAGLNQLPQEKNSHGTAMSNTMRQISGSIGISLFTSIFTNRSYFHFTNIAEQMNPTNSLFYQAFQSLVHKTAWLTGISPSQAEDMVIKMLYGQANQQAAVSGINDAFLWATFVTIIGLVLSLFLRDVRKENPSHETETQEKPEEKNPKKSPAPAPKEVLVAR